jgi:peptide/nickel transport system ATP-binding protein
LLLADEPTTALDVTIQAQILSLLKQLNEEQNLAIVLISHDLAVVSELCDEVIVLYAGEIIETGSADELLQQPLHPYTTALIKSIPSTIKHEEELFVIPGRIPPPANRPQGCLFASRCQRQSAACKEIQPSLINMGSNRNVRCLLYGAAHE